MAQFSLTILLVFDKLNLFGKVRSMYSIRHRYVDSPKVSGTFVMTYRKCYVYGRIYRGMLYHLLKAMQVFYKQVQNGMSNISVCVRSNGESLPNRDAEMHHSAFLRPFVNVQIVHFLTLYC